MASKFDLPLNDPTVLWEEDRKFVLRGWSLVFSVLATVMALSVLDGRMVYLQGSDTGYLGFWTNCKKYMCPNLKQVTVLIYMSKGFMMLALALCLVLLPSMGFSFRPVFRRLNKIDFVFSSLSIGIGLLIFLSLTLFLVNCELLHPKPQLSYMMPFYLCWCASALMLWAGSLSYLNQMGIWSKGMIVTDKQMSYRRWTLQQSVLTRAPRQHNFEQTSNQPSQCTSQSDSQVPLRSSNVQVSQDARQ